MVTGSSAHRRTSWLLLIAFLHAVLAPSLGLAMGKLPSDQTMRVQLCTMDGPQFVDVALSDAGATSDATMAQHGGICLLCVCPATPPDPCATAFRPATSCALTPALTPDAPRPLADAAWRPDLARAPPALI